MYCVDFREKLALLPFCVEAFSFLVVAPMHGFAFWFDVEFSGPASSPAKNTSETSIASGSSSISPSGEVNQKKRTNPSDALVLSTSPESPPTHWQQVRPCFCIYFLISSAFYQFYFSMKHLNW